MHPWRDVYGDETLVDAVFAAVIEVPPKQLPSHTLRKDFIQPSEASSIIREALQLYRPR